MSEPKQTPVHKVTCGNVSAAIWQNEGKNGPFLAATFQNRYQDAQGNYQNGESFSEMEAAALSIVAQQVAAYIAEKRPARQQDAANS